MKTNFNQFSIKFSFLGAIPLSFYDSYYFFGPGQGSAVNVTNCTTLNTAAAVMCLNKTGDTTIACIQWDILIDSINIDI